MEDFGAACATVVGAAVEGLIAAFEVFGAARVVGAAVADLRMASEVHFAGAAPEEFGTSGAAVEDFRATSEVF